jgi:hypothetical protein
MSVVACDCERYEDALPFVRARPFIEHRDRGESFRKGLIGERFRERFNARTKSSMVGDGVSRISAHEQHLQTGLSSLRFFRQSTTVHTSSQAHISKKLKISHGCASEIVNETIRKSGEPAGLLPTAVIVALPMNTQGINCSGANSSCRVLANCLKGIPLSSGVSVSIRASRFLLSLGSNRSQPFSRLT